MSNPNVILMVGFPASGKSKQVKEYASQGYEILSRDTEGGLLHDLIPKMEAFLARGKKVVIDATFMLASDRQAFREAAFVITKESPICHWMKTTIEDCQINALMRMYDRYGKCFLHPDDLKDPIVKKDPNMFPVAVLFKMKKEFEKPSVSEGFKQVIVTEFKREYRSDFTQKAIFIDYDGTVRDVPTDAEFKFPTKKSEVKLIVNPDILKSYKDAGYLILGASNQSGIARKQVTKEAVEECFCETNRQLGMDIEVNYCSHNVPPVCYCRKPQSGLFVPAIMKHKIDIRKSIFVGDQTTDETAAKRLGMTFAYASNFFSQK